MYEPCVGDVNEGVEGVLPKGRMQALYNAFVMHLQYDNATVVECPFCQAENVAELSIGTHACFECKDEFCLQCRLPVHAGILCEEAAEAPEDARITAQKIRTAGIIAGWAASREENKGVLYCQKCIRLQPTKYQPPIGVDEGCNVVQCPSCKEKYCVICTLSMTEYGADLHGHIGCDIDRPEDCTRGDGCTHCRFKGPRVWERPPALAPARVVIEID